MRADEYEYMVMQGQKHMNTLMKQIEENRKMKMIDTKQDPSQNMAGPIEGLSVMVNTLERYRQEFCAIQQSTLCMEGQTRRVQEDNAWLKTQFLEFADHKDSCDIRESADEGRIVEGIECTCGFAQLRVQFNADLRR